MKFSRISNSITSLKFPNRIKINNNSFLSEVLISVDYQYNDSLSYRIGRNLELYKKIGLETIRISNNEKKEIPFRANMELFYYTQHFLLSSNLPGGM